MREHCQVIFQNDSPCPVSVVYNTVAPVQQSSHVLTKWALDAVRNIAMFLPHWGNRASGTQYCLNHVQIEDKNITQYVHVPLCYFITCFNTLTRVWTVVYLCRIFKVDVCVPSLFILLYYCKYQLCQTRGKAKSGYTSVPHAS